MVKDDSKLPEAEKENLLKYLGAAKAEAQEQEPDKQLVVRNLKRLASKLKIASETVALIKSLWENAKSLLFYLPS